jgi:Ca2+-binding EF-hand superfamily protein
LPFPVLFLPFLAAVTQAPPVVVQKPVVVTGRGGVPFISPMGEPIRARSPNEDTLARWFSQVDLNHDGYLTAGELQAYAVSYFSLLDTNRDGQIDPDELQQYEWRIAPEIQVNSRLRRARAPGEAAAPKDDTSPAEDSDNNGSWHQGHGEERGDGEWETSSGRRNLDQGLQGAARYGLLNLPEPVAAADADFDRAITLQEFKQAAFDRFQLLDTGHHGRISLQELETIRTAMLAENGKKKRRRDELDPRLGSPLPPGNQ